jgi:hypothetical protein
LQLIVFAKAVIFPRLLFFQGYYIIGRAHFPAANRFPLGWKMFYCALMR